MKSSEKTLVGAALIVASIGLGIFVGMPQWTAYSDANTQVDGLNTDIKTLDASKEDLTSHIALLEKNTDIPLGVRVRRFNDQNREQIIKALLDQVSLLATSAGNRFISLAPSKDVQPMIEAPPVLKAAPMEAPATTTTTSTTATSDGSTADTSSSDSKSKVTPLPAPILSTFGYDMVTRGTYATIQNFLRLMNDQKELLEINGILVENEMVPVAGALPGPLANPNFPIRLTSHIRFALQPETP